MAPSAGPDTCMGSGGCPRRPPQHSTPYWYLFFFLRSRENSLAFFLWGRMGRGGLHLGEMRMWDWPDPFPHRQALRAWRKTKGQSTPDSLGVRRPQACTRLLLSEPRPWHPARRPEAVLTEQAAEDAPSNRA